MDRIRLFVADADPAHMDRVRRTIARCAGVEFIGSAPDGRFALEQIGVFQPDVLLTDIQLPVMDGLELIKRCRRMRVSPVCVVCTRFYSDLSVEYASRLGAAFFLYKPIDYGRLPAVIRDCWTAFRSPAANGHEISDSSDALWNILKEAGVPSNLRGKLYIEEAVRCLASDRWLLKNMTRGLYARIAEKTIGSPAQIERAIRNAIAIAYERGALNRVFRQRPSNRVFLEYLMYRIYESAPAPYSADGPPHRGIKI